MSTYSAITSAQYDAESYIDTTLSGQWVNNVLAMFEGDASASAVRLQTAAIATDAVLMSTKIDKSVGSDGFQNISSGASWVPAVGLYNFVTTDSNGTVMPELFISSVWRTPPTALTVKAGHIWCDGTNMRLTDVDALAPTVYYQKMA